MGGLYRATAATLCLVLGACGDDSEKSSVEPDAGTEDASDGKDSDASQDGLPEAFACVGKADARASGEAIYELIIKDALNNKVPADLQVTVCGAQDDVACESGPEGAKVSIDQDSAKLTVTGLPEDSLVHLKLEAPGYIPTKLFSSRPVRGKTQEPQATLMFATATVALIEGGARVKWDQETNGLLAVRVMNCMPEFAEGVSLSVSPSEGTKTVFMNATGLAVDAAAEETSASGAALIANAPGGTPLTIEGSVQGSKVSSFRIAAQAGWLTHVLLHPELAE